MLLSLWYSFFHVPRHSIWHFDNKCSTILSHLDYWNEEEKEPFSPITPICIMARFFFCGEFLSFCEIFYETWIFCHKFSVFKFFWIFKIAKNPYNRQFVHGILLHPLIIIIPMMLWAKQKPKVRCDCLNRYFIKSSSTRSEWGLSLVRNEA
jgi:hypothetical protein